MNLAEAREKVEALVARVSDKKGEVVLRSDVLAILGEEEEFFRTGSNDTVIAPNERKGQRRVVFKRRYDGLTMAPGTQILHYTRRHGKERRTNE